MTAAGVLSEEAERAAALALDLRALPDDFYDDPFPHYHRLRRWDPVHRGPDGSYFLTRYDDVVAVYQDHHTWSSDKRVEFAPKFGASPLYEHHTTSVVFRDPPDHTRIRKLFAPAFTPRALAALEPRVVRFVDGLLDRAAARGGMDVVEDFAAALPVQLIGDMLGVPREERGPLRGWSLAILGALEPEPGPRRLEAGSRAVDEFKGYLRRLIANAVVSLLEHPGEHLRLRAEPGLVTSAVEEFLRFQSPNQLGNRRAVRDAVLGGVAMDAGTLVTLGIGAANRDPAQFPDPDRLDITRTPNRHLAFITGIHACAGMWLARMEGRAAIGRLVARFPNLRAAGPPVRAHRARFRVVSSFPVTVG